MMTPNFQISEVCVGGLENIESFLVNPRDFKWLRKRFLSVASRVEMVMIFLFPIILSADAVSLPSMIA